MHAVGFRPLFLYSEMPFSTSAFFAHKKVKCSLAGVASMEQTVVVLRAVAALASEPMGVSLATARLSAAATVSSLTLEWWLLHAAHLSLKTWLTRHYFPHPLHFIFFSVFHSATGDAVTDAMMVEG